MDKTVDRSEANQLREHVKSNIVDVHTFGKGWPGNIELALVDTVLSIRARYGVHESTGVRGVVQRYKAASGRSSWDDLNVLAQTDPAWLAEVLQNRQKTGRVPKAEAIVSAAGRLAEVGASHSGAVDRDSAAQRTAYCGTKGLGPVTWEYFLMLVGHDGVKADTLVTRFVAEAIGRRPDAAAVAALVSTVAEDMGMRASDLDHTIWRHMSRPRRS